MKHYLNEFSNPAAYTTAKAGQNFYFPAVSLIDSNNEVKYDHYPAQVGDYLYPSLRYSSGLKSGKAPIAICVAPASHFSNGKARWMSLVNMSATDPEHGTTAVGNNYENNPGAGFCWGASGSITSLIESNEVPTLTVNGINQPTSSLSDSPVNYGYVPSDHFNSETISTPVTYPLDSNYSYYGDDEDMDGSGYGAIPSPFGQNGALNSWARLYALQYESGKSQTAAIIAGASKYSTGAITKNDAESGSYPAAIACSRFFTQGTQSGDWYLPSIAELMYVAVNLDLINSKLNSLGNIAVKVGDNLTAYDTEGKSDGLGFWLWSSSAYSSEIAWGLGTYACYANDFSRYNGGYGYRVRAFLEL